MQMKKDNELDTYMKTKETIINKLSIALYKLNELETSYAEKANMLLIDTDFKSVLNENRPTEAMRKAWIDNQLKELIAKINLEKTNIEVLKYELKTIDMKIKSEMKYLDAFIELRDYL